MPGSYLFYVRQGNIKSKLLRKVCVQSLQREGNKQLRSSSILNSCSCFPSERDSEPQCSRAKAQNIATILAKYFASCPFFFLLPHTAF